MTTPTLKPYKIEVEVFEPKRAHRRLYWVRYAADADQAVESARKAIAEEFCGHGVLSSIRESN